MSPPLSLLLSTPLALWQFDSATETLRCLHSGQREYYGISWNDSGIVLSHSLDDNVVPWSAGDCDREDRFGICAQRSPAGDTMSPRALLHPHQVECAGDRVVIANTGRNAIALWHPASRALGDTFLIASHWDGYVPDAISLHLNSVHVQDDLLYAVAHNGRLPSAVWVFRWPAMELHTVFSTSARWAHNAWHSAEFAGLLICDSWSGTLYSVDFGQAVWKAATPAALTRGLAATDDVIVVGLSEFTPRAERATSKGGFAIVERSTLRTLDEYWFDGIGNVHEVRVASEPDACHTSVPLTSLARAWVDEAAASHGRSATPNAKSVAVPVMSTATLALPPLPAQLEYGEGSTMSVEMRVAGIARVRTERFGDSNLVLATVPVDACPAGGLLRASAWCTVDSVDGEAYGLLRICFRDRRGEFMPELEARSQPAGFLEAPQAWVDVACVMPTDARVRAVDVLWLQSGIAAVDLKGCAFSVTPLPGPLSEATPLRTRF